MSNYNILEQNRQEDVIYIDFGIAFNKVDHEILIRKLGKIGLSLHMFKLFATYLHSCTSVVKFGGNTSGIYSGMPQARI